jgi:hypothetical protein
MCRPHKRFKSNSLHQQTPSIRRVFEGHRLDLRDDPPRVVDPMMEDDDPDGTIDIATC